MLKISTTFQSSLDVEFFSHIHLFSVDVLLITLLDSGDKEVVYIACGVLINFMVDEEKRAILKSEGGITK